MSYCLNRRCPQPQNPADGKFCIHCGTPLRLRDRYRLLQPLGNGGFGRTFWAIDEDLPSRPDCVVKQLHACDRHTPLGAKMLELFHREAEQLDRLGEHPQIPALLAYFEQDGEFYLVQERIDGDTLARELQQTGTFSEAQLRQLLQQLLPVLQYIHDRHVIHRDIKPANLMRRRSSGEIVLIDFGAIKAVSDTRLGATGTTIGSAEFMAPEQHRGQAFPASDLYSLGATCVHLLTGMSPLELYDLARGCWKWRPYLPLSRQISPQFADLLDKLLEAPLNRRFRRASEVLKALEPPAVPLRSPTTPSQPAKSQLAKSKPKPAKPTKPRRSLLQRARQFYAGLRDDPEPLPSDVGLDYTPLRNALRKRDWKTGDRLTHESLCYLARGTYGGYLSARDVSRLPCTDLHTLDRLWSQHSEGRFGFRIQQQIYRDVAGNYPEFCLRLGWRVARSPAESFQFNRRAPAGHLPSRRWAGGLQLWRQFAELDRRLDACDSPSDDPNPSHSHTSGMTY